MKKFTIMVVLVVAAVLLGSPPAQAQHYTSRSPAVVTDPKLRKVYEFLYPYYQKPRYRYPFYDGEGNGELLYGYGGPRLFRYTVFKPVEGYLRRR
ncbi:uncharacterized protein LOC123512623 [Portunus trituberculatus]|uniref:uncharacterized protein LOC123512623 n=1 Tax=Portunus trituberculatus TaxID=210409 RepID=UPI001E1D1D24|nr:uncharacterized protein LOC123512623 [Portunus trituberculatus]